MFRNTTRLFKRSILLSVLFVFVGLTQVAAASAPGPIRSYFSNKCIDVTNGDPNQYVQQWTCFNGNDNQKWEVKSIFYPPDYSLVKNPRTGKCLSAVSNANGGDGVKLQIWSCSLADNQSWLVYGR